MLGHKREPPALLLRGPLRAHGVRLRPRLPLRQRVSKCDLQTGSVGLAWELARKADFAAAPNPLSRTSWRWAQ